MTTTITASASVRVRGAASPLVASAVVTALADSLGSALKAASGSVQVRR